jgi:hypothetical protein
MNPSSFGRRSGPAPPPIWTRVGSSRTIGRRPRHCVQHFGRPETIASSSGTDEHRIWPVSLSHRATPDSSTGLSRTARHPHCAAVAPAATIEEFPSFAPAPSKYPPAEPGALIEWAAQLSSARACCPVGVPRLHYAQKKEERASTPRGKDPRNVGAMPTTMDPDGGIASRIPRSGDASRPQSVIASCRPRTV